MPKMPAAEGLSGSTNCCREHLQQRTCTGLRLLDHLDGAGEDCGRDGEAERLRGLQVDHELEPGRLLDREVGGLGALEDLVYEAGSLAVQLSEVRPKRYEAARVHVFTKSVNGRQSVGDGKLHQGSPVGGERTSSTAMRACSFFATMRPAPRSTLSPYTTSSTSLWVRVPPAC